MYQRLFEKKKGLTVNLRLDKGTLRLNEGKVQTQCTSIRPLCTMTNLICFIPAVITNTLHFIACPVSTLIGPSHSHIYLTELRVRFASNILKELGYTFEYVS